MSLRRFLPRGLVLLLLLSGVFGSCVLPPAGVRDRGLQERIRDLETRLAVREREAREREIREFVSEENARILRFLEKGLEAARRESEQRTRRLEEGLKKELESVLVKVTEIRNAARAAETARGRKDADLLARVAERLRDLETGLEDLRKEFGTAIEHAAESRARILRSLDERRRALAEMRGASRMQEARLTKLERELDLFRGVRETDREELRNLLRSLKAEVDGQGIRIEALGREIRKGTGVRSRGERKEAAGREESGREEAASASRKEEEEPPRKEKRKEGEVRESGPRKETRKVSGDFGRVPPPKSRREESDGDTGKPEVVAALGPRREKESGKVSGPGIFWEDPWSWGPGLLALLCLLWLVLRRPGEGAEAEDRVLSVPPSSSERKGPFPGEPPRGVGALLGDGEGAEEGGRPPLCLRLRIPAEECREDAFSRISDWLRGESRILCEPPPRVEVRGDGSLSLRCYLPGDLPEAQVEALRKESAERVRLPAKRTEA